MSRIEGVPRKKAGWWTRLLYWMVKRKVGKLIEPLTIMAHTPPVMWGCSMMEGGLIASKRVDAGIKELAQIKVAMLVGCPF